MISNYSEVFDCERLIDNNNYSLLPRFRAINNADGITNYFKNQALKDDEENIARNYVVKIKNSETVIAMFTLKSGAIPYNEGSEDLLFSKNTKLIPGIELVNIALNDFVLSRIRKYSSKVGKHIFFKIIQNIVLSVSDTIGVKVLYLFAANEKLAQYYTTWGFKEIPDIEYKEKLKKEWQNEYSQSCIFMYKPIAEIN